MTTYEDKAIENIKKWGEQDMGKLLIIALEELGEIAQAYLQCRYETGDQQRIRNECVDLGAVVVQMELASWGVKRELRLLPRD